MIAQDSVHEHIAKWTGVGSGALSSVWLNIFEGICIGVGTYLAIEAFKWGRDEWLEARKEGKI